MKKKRIILTAVKIAAVVMLSVIALGFAAPVYFIVIRSVSSDGDLFPLRMFPEEFSFVGFERLFGGMSGGVPYSRNFFSSLMISVITAAVQVPVICAMAYVTAKVKAPLIGLFDRLIEWTLILTPLALYAPQYFLMLKIGLSDSYFAMILPFVASPLLVYIVKRYMSAVPDEVVYSARIDGASHPRICFTIVMPEIKPAVFAVVILSFGNMWSYTGELFARSAGVKPFAALMGEFAFGEENAVIFCAAAVIIVVPIIVLTAVFGKKIAQTAALAGLKCE